MMWRIRKNKHESKPSLEQQRAEMLAEMGTQLWTLRLQQGLSLEEMVMLTKIPQRLLKAIEEGNLNELPEPIYIKGLLRQFADALGLNGAEFSSSFPIGLNRVTLKPKWKNSAMNLLRPIHLYLLYIFLILCSVSGLSQLLNTATLQASNSPTKPKARQIVVKSQATQNKKPQQLQFGEPPSSIATAQQVQINVTLKEKSWIRVVVDGKIEYEGELPVGTQRIWKAQEQLTVRAGNAGGVLVSVNKQEAKQMGESGKVKEVTIAANTRS